MTDAEPEEPEDTGFEEMMGKFLADLRKSASIQAGAVLFGQAQVAYYEVLKEGMGEEAAFGMLAHTTEKLFGALAHAAGPIVEAMTNASLTQDRLKREDNATDSD